MLFFLLGQNTGNHNIIMRINVGCGQTPVDGWRNFDNSYSLCLARIKHLPELLYKINLLESSQYEFIKFCRSKNIEYGDAVKKLPLANESIDVFYCSHMIEHLDRIHASMVIKEAMRVLHPGGIIRLVVPDLQKLVVKYLESKDADQFIFDTYLCQPRARTIRRRIRDLIVGPRNHQWMYDGESLCRLLIENGFKNVCVMQPGETRIENPEPLNLKERELDSVYVEADC